MGDKGTTNKLLVNKTSSIPPILYSFALTEVNSTETDEKQFTETASGFSEKPATGVNCSNTYVLHPNDYSDADQDTTKFTHTPIPSPEVSRRESLNFSIRDENFITNVQPISFLTPSPGLASHTTGSPLLSFDDLNRTYSVNNTQLHKLSFYQLETEANCVAAAQATKRDADTEDESDGSSKPDRRCKISSSRPSSIQNLIVIKPLTSKDSYPSSNLPKELFEVNLASVDGLDSEERPIPRARQDRIFGETTSGRSQSASDLRLSKLSHATRSSPDLAKTSRPKPTKTIISHALPDYSKVPSKVRQYKEEIDALSRKPRVALPTARPTESLDIPLDRQPIFNRAVHPESNYADKEFARVGLKSFRLPKLVPKVSIGTQTTPQTDPVPRRLSLLSNSRCDAVIELVRDVREKIELADKEKLAYQKAYEASEKESERLEAYIEQCCQIRDGALSPSGSLKIEDARNDANDTSDQKSISSASGRKSSSSSGSLLHPGPESKTVVTEVQNTVPIHDTSNILKVHKEPASLVNSSQEIGQSGPSVASSQGVQPFAVMGVRHKMALAKNVTTRRPKFFYAHEIETDGVSFSPKISVGSNTNSEASVAIATDPREDLIQPTSQLPAEYEDEDAYPRHISKMMWKAGFFLNKAATSIIPEAQEHLNLRSPREFCALRKLTSRMRIRTNASVGKNTMRSSVSSVASSQTTLSSRLRAKFHLPSITPKTRRRSKSCETFQMFEDR